MTNLDVVKCPGCPEPMRADAIERLQNNMQLQVWRQHADNYEIHVLLVSTQLISYDLTISPCSLSLSLSLSLHEGSRWEPRAA